MHNIKAEHSRDSQNAVRVESAKDCQFADASFKAPFLVLGFIPQLRNIEKISVVLVCHFGRGEHLQKRVQLEICMIAARNRK
jgi:hypothetical protein